MKLHYTAGCICTSLTVDGKETIDLSEKKMKEVVKKMVSYIWKPENDCIYYIVKYLVQTVGEFNSMMFGDVPCYNEITTNRYDCDKKNYLVCISVPTDEFLLVNKLVCDYAKVTRQDRWDNKKHCTKEFLKASLEMIDKLDDFADLQWIFCQVMEAVGKSDEPYQCGCCGDWVYPYDLEID